MNRFLAVLKKELKDSIRDRRSIMVASLGTILFPILIVFMFHAIAQQFDTEENQILAVIGKQHAPDLIAYLEKNDIIIEEFSGDPKTAIQNREFEVVLKITPNYNQDFSHLKPGVVQLMADTSMSKSAQASERIEKVISSYSMTIGGLRLLIRGVDPSITTAVKIESQDFSTPQGRAGMIFGSLQMMILMAAFLGASAVAIDTTAGERERKSLEPLLVHPLSSLQILAGKWTTVVFYAALSIFIAIISTSVALHFASLKPMGLDPQISLTMVMSLFALMLPVALFAASILMLTSLFAKTFKEAQSYVGFIIILPMLPAMIMPLVNVKSVIWMYFVPVLGQQQLLDKVLRGENLDMMPVLFASASSIAIALAIFMVLTHLLRSERVVYGS